jgi:hypothetical protein
LINNDIRCGIMDGWKRQNGRATGDDFLIHSPCQSGRAVWGEKVERKLKRRENKSSQEFIESFLFCFSLSFFLLFWWRVAVVAVGQ